MPDMMVLGMSVRPYGSKKEHKRHSGTDHQPPVVTLFDVLE
jgi:hypothetical protein